MSSIVSIFSTDKIVEGISEKDRKSAERVKNRKKKDRRTSSLQIDMKELI